MTQRNKALIVIAGGVVVIVAVVLTIFDLWPGGTDQPVQEPTEDLSFLEEEPRATNTTFDASNKDAFAEVAGVPNIGIEQSAEERAAQGIAELFIEAYGTYSNDTGFSYIRDLQGYMTASMFQWAQTQYQGLPERTSSFAILTRAAGTRTITFDAKSRAVFSVTTMRTEMAASGQEEYRQEVTLQMVWSSNQWLVDRVVWGDRSS